MTNVKVLVAKPGLDNVLVIGDGIIPDADIPSLKATGITEVFTPCTPTSAIVDFILTRIKIKSLRDFCLALKVLRY